MPKLPMNYANTILYKIQHDTNNSLIYVGNTTSFKQRKSLHKRCCERGDTSSKLYVMINENGGWASFRMIPIKEYPCKSYHDAVIEEDRIRHEMNIPPYISKYRNDHTIIPIKQTVLNAEPPHTCYENVIKTVILEDTINQPSAIQTVIIPNNTVIIPNVTDSRTDNTVIIPNVTDVNTDPMTEDELEDEPVLKLNKHTVKVIPIMDYTMPKKRVSYINDETRNFRIQLLRNMLNKKSPNTKIKRNPTLKRKL